MRSDVDARETGARRPASAPPGDPPDGALGLGRVHLGLSLAHNGRSVVSLRRMPDGQRYSQLGRKQPFYYQ
jgi:hypothetical protein